MTQALYAHRNNKTTKKKRKKKKICFETNPFLVVESQNWEESFKMLGCEEDLDPGCDQQAGFE
jgi:hypothetical protein